jgi:OHCU decarboxylase
MEGARPFRSADDLAAAADRIWRSLSKDDWLEAFAAHPKLGSPRVVAGTGPADLHPPQPNAGTGFNLHPPQPTNLPPPNSDRSRAWSRHEQAGTKGASPETLANLADANRDYEERFGHIFIVCASGRNAGEMLALLESRLHNEPQRELEIAAEEQRKITRLRLEKLLATEGE